MTRALVVARRSIPGAAYPEARLAEALVRVDAVALSENARRAGAVFGQAGVDALLAQAVFAIDGGGACIAGDLDRAGGRHMGVAHLPGLVAAIMARVVLKLLRPAAVGLTGKDADNGQCRQCLGEIVTVRTGRDGGACKQAECGGRRSNDGDHAAADAAAVLRRRAGQGAGDVLCLGGGFRLCHPVLLLRVACAAVRDGDKLGAGAADRQ